MGTNCNKYVGPSFDPEVFNRLVQEKANSELKEGIGGSSNDEQKQLLQLFCGMRLGVTFQAAQVKVVTEHLGDSSYRYFPGNWRRPSYLQS